MKRVRREIDLPYKKLYSKSPTLLELNMIMKWLSRKILNKQFRRLETRYRILDIFLIIASKY